MKIVDHSANHNGLHLLWLVISEERYLMLHPREFLSNAHTRKLVFNFISVSLTTLYLFQRKN